MSMSAHTLEQSLKYYLTTDSAVARPTAWTISLHSADPGTAGTANEVAYSGYARQSATFSVSLADPTAPIASNTTLIEYPVNAASYTVTHIVVWGGANPLVIQALNNSKTILAGVKAQITAGELTIGGRN